MKIRHDWKEKELLDLHKMPLLKLVSLAHETHKEHHSLNRVQKCSLVSIKTGGCTENCSYCSQSMHYNTAVKPLPFMEKEKAVEEAKRAIANGATRICLGAAWRGIREGRQFDTILSTVSEIKELGVEVCCTLGLLTKEQALRLKKAGLFAYNHNLDTSPSFYSQIITTRSFEERLETIERVEAAGLSLCSGVILGMGEEIVDRLQLLETLANRPKHPESFPINLLVPIKGTPLEEQKEIPYIELLRFIATARIALPKAWIRLSAGRERLSSSEHLLAFFAGVNALFLGEKLLTAPNRSMEKDEELFKELMCEEH